MNWIKEYYPTVVISIIILALLEFGARLVFDELPYRGNYTDKVLGQIYGKENIDDYRTVLEEGMVKWKYHPFVEYKETARSGKFVTVSSDNTRCNINGNDQCKIEQGRGVIWVFGGSTVFGYGVKNDETITAYISKALPDYKVINMGHASYYSTQERILFNEKLSEGLVPEIAIFIDGLNDFYYYDVPNFSAASRNIQKLFNKDFDSSAINSYLKSLIKRSKLVLWLYSNLKSYKNKNELEENEPLLQPDPTLLKVIDRLQFNFLSRRHIGDIFGVKVINVLQPVPGYGVGHQTSNVPTHLLRFGGFVNTTRGYQLIKKEGFDFNFSYLDLSSLSIDAPMYVDTVHYTPEFNKEIAMKVSEEIVNSLLDE